jgi:hypothetical protein
LQIEYAIKTGEFLLKAKEQVPHGGWENWFKSEVELPFSSLTQTKSYMRLARDKELVYVISNDDSAFNLDDEWTILSHRVLNPGMMWPGYNRIPIRL